MYDTTNNNIQITREEQSQFNTPFDAVNAALTMRRSLGFNTKFLIDGQLMSAKQAEKWANDEYKYLPKCECCNKILNGNVYTNSFSCNSLFCSQDCRNKDSYYWAKKIEEEDEYDCDFI